MPVDSIVCRCLRASGADLIWDGPPLHCRTIPPKERTSTSAILLRRRSAHSQRGARFRHRRRRSTPASVGLESIRRREQRERITEDGERVISIAVVLFI